MFNRIKNSLFNNINSRLLSLTIVFLALSALLVYRVFVLQIVKGEDYLNNFQLQIQKERTVSAARGNIYDKNGELLAYNELAYSVKIEDVYESGKKKNAQLNDTIYRLIKMIERNGDTIINDFDIVIDQDGEFAFTLEGTKQLRFLADVYGHSHIDKLEYSEKTATADDVVAFLAGKSKFGIGGYTDPDDSSTFQVGMGYTKEELLKILTIRYAMNANSYQKYIATTVATDVSEETVAVIMENNEQLEGVSIAEDTVRKYVDSEYFCHIIGYTGKASNEELESLQQEDLQSAVAGAETGPHNYTQSDIIGKSGIESYMELTLQGIKGSETVYVDNLGKVIDTSNYVEAVAGNDVYLTLDKNLQEAAYDILEQKIAGILLNQIVNVKEYDAGENAKSTNIKIPIYDVYVALFQNDVIDFSHFSEENAGETEKSVYGRFEEYKTGVLNKVREELTEGRVPYQNLTLEYQIYESYISSMLSEKGIILDSEVDTSDAVYIAWKKDETISLAEYIEYAVSMNWVDVSKLELSGKYSDSEEIYQKIVDYIITEIDNNSEFYKKIYRFMIKGDKISGREVCIILCEQGIIEVDMEEEKNLYNGSLSPYNFLLNRIENLDITPAQLALDPYSGSMVITDVNTGKVLAMVSYPGYDNNRLANTMDADYWAQLLNDDSNPLLNYATQQRTAPGSTFKMISSTAGLMEGVIDTSSTITCTGIFDKINPMAKCWIYPSAHGSMNVTGGIQHSCNDFFYEVGYRLSTAADGTYNTELGLSTLEKYADMYGLTETTGVEVEEYEPVVSTQDPVRSAIGQGNSGYTTVGLARYVTAVANRGTCYNLTLIDRVTDRNGSVLYENEAEVRNRIDMPSSYWDAIQAGMRKVVEGKTYFEEAAVNVAGKTGTAEEKKGRANHALFVCFAPYENPEIAIATRIAYGYTSDYAAQTTKEVIKYYYGGAEEKEEILNGAAAEVEQVSGGGD